MKYDKSVKDYVLSNVDISDLVSTKVDLKRVGANMRGLCPFHSEKTASFYVSDSRMSYYCFGCKNHGNAIDFVMQTENMEFLEALESLSDRYHLGLSPYIIHREAKKDFNLINKIYDMNKEAGKFFHMQLLENPFAMEYFQDRQIEMPTVKAFGLGYSPESWSGLLDHLKKMGYSEDEVLRAGLASKSENGNIYDRFRNRLMFPIFDYRSRILGFGARSIGDDMPKYLNSPESEVFQKSRILYGDRMSRKAGKIDTVILVEGYMDLIQLYQVGFPSVLASMGTALSPEQVHHISKRYNFVQFAYDMDEAGRNAISRSIPLLENYGIDVKILDISPAKDPDEFIKKFGKLAFKERLESAQNTIHFRLMNIRQKYDLSDAKERYNFVMESIGLISGFCGQVEGEIYLQELSKISSISYDKILSEFNAFSKEPVNSEATGILTESKKEDRYEKMEEKSESRNEYSEIGLYERRLLAFSAYNKDYALRIFESTSGEFFTEEFVPIFSILMMYYSTNQDFDPILISEDFDLESGICLQEILDSTEGEFTEEELDFLLKRWESEKVKIEIEGIDLEIKSLSFLDDEEAKIELRILRKKRSKLLKSIYESIK